MKKKSVLILYRAAKELRNFCQYPDGDAEPGVHSLATAIAEILEAVAEEEEDPNWGLWMER